MPKNLPSLLAAVGLALSNFAGVAAHAAEYDFHVLPSLSSSYLNGPALGGNDWSAGTSVNPDGTQMATVWRGTKPVDYGLPGFDYSRAASLNDVGDVVGFASAAGVWRAIHWYPGGYRLLPSLDGQTTVATAVNHAGQIVGFSGSHAVMWDGDLLIDLSGSQSIGGTPNAINSAGTVVGYVSAVGGVRAAKWKGGLTFALDPLDGGVSSVAMSVNDSEQVVGCSNDIEYTAMSPVLWQGAVATRLVSLSDSDGEGCANAINEAGVIVGSIGDVATRWRGGKVVDLNRRVAQKVRDKGWRLIKATGINQAGRIVGTANNVTTGESAFFLLIPKQ